MSDVGSRTPKQSLLQRKASHQGSDGQTPDERNYEGYYAEDGWWEEDGYHHFGSYDASYYEEWHGEGRADDIFEVDLYSMVFVLDENLAPKDMYNGFEFEEKTFLFSIEAEDVTPSTPAAWKSRPLKIHPEPPPYRKDMASTPPARSGHATDANTGGSNTPTGPGGRTPRQKAAIPPKIDTPKDTLPPLATTPPRRPVEPPSKEDSEQSGDELAGKIHINNKQLEHLKQKMQALKQRRASLPEKEKDDKDGKEKDKEKKEEKKDKEKVEKEKDKENHKKDESHTNGPKRTEGTVHSNCPGAHGLSLFKTPARGWWCSVCEKEHDKGSAFYGCRTCDYDECEACAMTPRPKAAPQVPKPPDKPSAPVESGRTNNSNSTPAKARGGTTKNSTPPPKKKVSSSSSSSSSSGDSSKSRSPSRSPSKKSPKKETKKDKGDSKKKANSKEKNVKKGDAKRDAQDKGDKADKGDKGDKGDKRKAAKVKVKKTVKRPCKAKSKSRSDDKSDDKAKKKSKNTRKTKRAASDPKLVPRKPKDAKEAKEESREPKRRKEEKEVSPKKAARSRSRDSDSSQSEEPPKKRAANALTVAEPRAPVSLTRASAARRNEEEKPAADEGTRARRNAPAEAEARGRSGRGAGGDLLRRVLRANAVHNARQDGGPTRSKDGEPRATLVPPTRKDESSSEESVPRGAATLRPPQDRGVKKAEARKSRRV